MKKRNTMNEKKSKQNAEIKKRENGKEKTPEHSESASHL